MARIARLVLRGSCRFFACVLFAGLLTVGRGLAAQPALDLAPPPPGSKPPPIGVLSQYDTHGSRRRIVLFKINAPISQPLLNRQPPGTLMGKRPW